MIKKSFFFFSLLFLPLSADVVSLKPLIQQAKAGDYVTFSRNKNYTLLVVKNKTPKEITIEEISIPEPLFPKQYQSWREWLEEGAPCQTARVLYKIDLERGHLTNYYSYNHKSQMDVNQTDNLFSKLLNLTFTPIPPNERKGMSTSDGKRKPWNPKMVVDGKQIPNVWFQALETKWPNDGSELSGKSVHLYLPEPSPKYPGYFPYWIKIQSALGKANLRVVDSGRGLINKSVHPLE